MEDFSKTQSTFGTAAHFNNILKPIDLKDIQPRSSQDYQIAQEKSQQSSLFQSNNQYPKLSTRINMLEIELQRVKQQNKRILQDSILEQTAGGNLRKYQQASQYNSEIEKQMKSKINTQTAKLEREIQELYKNKLNCTKQSDKQIKQQIQDLKELQQGCFNEIRKQMKNRFQQIKHQANQLKKQTITYRKQNNLFKQDLFEKLNFIRSRLNSQILQEEQKRKSYDEIVQNLLQKSCMKAQQSLRRKLY